MRRHVLYVVLLAGASTVPALAQPLHITQGMPANVYGVLQVGPQVRPTTVTQAGAANVAGVMQAGAGGSVAIRQSGRLNGAYVGRNENFFAGTRAQMP